MQEGSHSWRAFLRDYIASPSKRQSLAQAARLNPVTLVRWTQPGDTKPHGELLGRVALALPQPEREQFVRLVQQEYSDFVVQEPEEETSSSFIERTPELIPDEFMYRVHRAYSHTHHDHVFSTIVQLVSQQMVTHLGDLSVGVSLLLLTPPKAGRPARSLYTPLRPVNIWPASAVIHYPVLLGRDNALSLALLRHEVCVYGHEALVDDPSMLSIRSVASIGLRKWGRVGGCLILLSPEEEYFQHPKRLRLIERYSYLLALALEDFYDPDNIQLEVLPPLQDQQFQEKQLSFAQRLAQLQRSAQTFIALRDLERAALQELEDVLLGATTIKEYI